MIFLTKNRNATLFSSFLGVALIHFVLGGIEDFWKNVVCDEKFSPDNCDFQRIPLPTVEDFERCAPAELPLYVRNYYLGWGGRGVTYRENIRAYNRIRIIPKMLRNISSNSLEITTLGQRVAFPIGISPTALMKLANPGGEIAVAAAAVAMNTIMIQSSYSQSRIEDVAEVFKDSSAHLWFQLYVFKNRTYTTNIVKRAERSGVKALVLTVDSYVFPPVLCDAKKDPRIANIQMANFPETFDVFEPAVMNFNDIRWLKSITKLPIIVKGILTGDDARRVILSGASAILVSNHGGRQLDNTPATIDVLAEVVDAVSRILPRRDVYVDGGIRNGFDVYKAIARGAKMVFVGRPTLWGLTLGGEEGVKKVLNILKTEFNSTMLLTGAANPGEIRRQNVRPPTP